MCVCVCVLFLFFHLLVLKTRKMFLSPPLCKCFGIRAELDYPLQLSPTRGEHELCMVVRQGSLSIQVSANTLITKSPGIFEVCFQNTF